MMATRLNVVRLVGVANHSLREGAQHKYYGHRYVRSSKHDEGDREKWCLQSARELILYVLTSSTKFVLPYAMIVTQSNKSDTALKVIVKKPKDGSPNLDVCAKQPPIDAREHTMVW